MPLSKSVAHVEGIDVGTCLHAFPPGFACCTECVVRDEWSAQAPVHYGLHGHAMPSLNSLFVSLVLSSSVLLPSSEV